jgi:DNA-binding NarL/FixJ family response regulator
MPTPTIRVLLVEDYQPFRHFVMSSLQDKLALDAIDEAVNGLEAVQKAQELQPQLILLDIGLPELNGIEAARQIKSLSPDSRILFVSQETSGDIVEAALATGAQGYVAKMDAGGELFAAIAAVLRGEKYVSKIPTSNLRSSQTQVASLYRRPIRIDSPPSHEVTFYSDERSLLDGFTLFTEKVLKRGDATILIAKEFHQQAVLVRLQTSGLDMKAVIEQGRYVALDPAEMLSSIMIGDLPDPVRFSKITTELIAKTAESVDEDPRRVAACGECAPLLWERGNPEAAVRLEHLWDTVTTPYGVRTLCGYLLPSFQGGIGSFIFERICKEHSAVLSR